MVSVIPMPHPSRLIAISLLVWAMTVLVLGLFASFRLLGPIPPTAHPYFVLATLLPVMGLYFLDIRRLNQAPPSRETSERLLRHYASLFLIGSALLTGVAAMMRFLPAFFHQVVVWPFVALTVLWTIKTLRN